jgi:hypothetical protein
LPAFSTEDLILELVAAKVLWKIARRGSSVSPRLELTSQPQQGEVLIAPPPERR